MITGAMENKRGQPPSPKGVGLMVHIGMMKNDHAFTRRGRALGAGGW